MTDREKLIKNLKYCSEYDADCMECERWGIDCGSSSCVEDLMAKAAVALEQQEWIPVTERLPDEGDRCLCIVKSFAFPGSSYQAILRYDKYGFVEGCIYTDDVTHWMPLPEPPEMTK